jgi:hypothetical protein
LATVEASAQTSLRVVPGRSPIVIMQQLVELHQLVSHPVGHLLVDPTPSTGNFDPNPSPPPGLDTLGSTFISWTKWILRICGVVGLMACGIMMVVGRRQRSAFAADGAAGIPWVLGGLTLGAIAAIVVSSVHL